MTTILLIEDEPGIADPLAKMLEREGHPTIVAGSLRDARAQMSPKVGLVILDWMLPDGQGIELLKEWRHAGIATPVIIVTARDELIDKVLGLELGADDYVTKPFAARELLARVKARLRGRGEATAPAAGGTLSFAGVHMDLDTRAVSYGGRPLELTKMEFALLRLLLENPNKVFTRDELLNRVWGYEGFPTTRTVDTHVLQLRQKTSSELFETVRGVGYRMTNHERNDDDLTRR